MKFHVAATLALFALSSMPAGSQTAVSAHDEDACRPDVFRLCGSFIPDEASIVACLNQKATELSPACHSVISPDEPLPHKAKKLTKRLLRQ